MGRRVFAGDESSTSNAESVETPISDSASDSGVEDNKAKSNSLEMGKIYDMVF